MASQPIYEMYAELKEYEPKMWRRFQVMNNISMARLAYIIMTMFEMEANHLFCFEVPFAENYFKEQEKRCKKEDIIDIFKDHPELIRWRIELLSEEDDCPFEGRIMDAEETKLKQVLGYAGDKLSFEYDFGDGWEIMIVLEKILEDSDISGKELPRVLEGEGYGIIEDCGGPGGLENLVKVFRRRKGEEYEYYKKWLGKEELDLSIFDLKDINFRLKKLPRIYRDIYEYGLEPTAQSMKLLRREYK